MTHIPPPKPFNSWIEYAIETMDVRNAYIDRLFDDEQPPSQADIRKAANDELNQLKEKVSMRWIAMLENWKVDLSKRLGRSVDEIVSEGLVASDFTDHVVHIKFMDGSELKFQRAFFLGCNSVDGNIHRVAVFAENCGFHEFWVGPNDRIS